jgi:two-component system, OmpR family, KDP operon response regulator KdpE
MAAEKYPLTAESGASGATLLIVEDHPETSLMLSMLFQDEGYQVLTAPNTTLARSALTRAHDTGQCLDLLLLDLTMPDSDPVSMLSDLRSGGLELPPIIIMSARPSSELDRAVQILGAACRIQKPFAVAKMLTLVGEVVGTPTPPSDCHQDVARSAQY